MIKAACRKGMLILLAVLLVLSAVSRAPAQEDYPIPPGNPNRWGIPGRTDEFRPPEPRTPQGPQDMFSAPPLPGNEKYEQPYGPEGEDQEKYTGTRVFGGIGGTGIGEFGPHENR